MKKHDLRVLHVDQYKAMLALMMVHSVDFVISENFHAPLEGSFHIFANSTSCFGDLFHGLHPSHSYPFLSPTLFFLSSSERLVAACRDVKLFYFHILHNV